MTHGPNASVAVVGDGSSTVVLVPGMDGTGKLFYRQVPLLARQYRVVTYALSDAAPTMEILVEDLATIIDAVSPDRTAIVVGESFGGALALSFGLARPQQVSGLVILNSFPFFAPQWRLRIAIGGLQMLPWGAMGLVRRLTASRLHSRHTHRDEIRRFMQLTAATTREGYLGRLRILTQYDVRNRLQHLRMPTLFLAADCDHLVPSVAQAKYMGARVPKSRVRVLEGHGHTCLIAPDIDLRQLIEDWRRERES